MGKRSKHEKSIHKLRNLPRCSRDKTELILVTATYADSNYEYEWEWECPRCNRIIPYALLKTEAVPQEDLYLTKTFGNNEAVPKTSPKRRRRTVQDSRAELLQSGRDT